MQLPGDEWIPCNTRVNGKYHFVLVADEFFITKSVGASESTQEEEDEEGD